MSPVPVFGEPPAIVRNGERHSKYVDRENFDTVVTMIEARKGWVQPSDPLPAKGNARIAVNAYRRELARRLGKDEDAFATRVFPVEVKNGNKAPVTMFNFMLTLKDGA